MERTRPKIELYRTRSFSEKLNAAFDFCTENWKAIMKWYAYLALPLCFVSGYFYNAYFKDVFSLRVIRDTDPAQLVNALLSFFLSAGGWTISVLLLSWVSVSLFYALLRLYDEREERLNDLTFEELRPVLLRNMGRIFVLSLLIVLSLAVLYTALIALIVGAFEIHTGLGVLLILLVLMGSFVLFIALALTGPTCLLDDEVNVTQSLFKGLRLGVKTFGGVFAVGAICSLISWVVSCIAMIPYYVSVLPSLFQEGGADAFTPSGIEKVWATLSTVCMLFVNYISYVLPMLGMGYQYGHAANKLDNKEPEYEEEIRVDLI